MVVSWFSCGISSFIACYLIKDEIDQIIYTHVPNQHKDSLRFLHDCEKLLGKEIIVLQSERYKGVRDVIRKVKYINGASGAACTRVLKKQVRKDWEKNNPGFHTYIWGYDINENNRANRIQETLSDYEHRFPLIENNLTKEDCHAIAKDLGLKRPKMYDLGYKNNNCVGCVKGGMGYWNKIRVDFPKTFKKMAQLERELGRSCIRGTFLDELEPNRGRIEEEVMEECSIACQLIIK